MYHQRAISNADLIGEEIIEVGMPNVQREGHHKPEINKLVSPK